MNNYQTGNIKLEKLAKENSAFQNCQPDMSDVNFEIGKSSSTVKIFAAIAAFALIYGIRYFLASAPNQVFTREQLLDNIWGYEYIGDTRTVDVHIKRIREKIKDHAHWNIETVWGIGYKFVTK